VPRATIDIDLNVFVPPQEHGELIATLSNEFSISDRDSLAAEIAEHGQGKTYWDETRIDLFFAAFDFHDSMAERARIVPYESTSIPILSAEDILLAKAFFDRTQDWADIEAVCNLRGEELDVEYLGRWLEEIVGLDDPRAARLMSLVETG
jgi:hypothetical protein